MADNKDFKVCVIGLGAMGMGAARSCVNAGLAASGVDIIPDKVERFFEFGAAKGARGAASALPFAGELDAVQFLVVNADQEREVLFKDGLADALKPGCVVLLSSTIGADDAREIGAELLKRGLLVLDAPVSGGAVKAAAGDMTVMASGSAEAFAKAKPMLDAVAGKVYNIGTELGQGTLVKILHQLLAGVHVATAAEAMALAARAGISQETLFDVVTHAAGNSWMFENRMSRFVAGDRRDFSKIDILVKDMGLVVQTGLSLKFPLPIASAALSQYVNAHNAGFGGDDDSLLMKVYAGTKIPEGNQEGSAV